MIPALAVCLVLLLAACNKFTAANFAKIQPGQTEEQVRKLIGPPTSVSSGGFLIYTGTVYKYEKNGKTAQLVFGNGKLIYKEGEL
ncbi:MAG: outer membrane protein assembly factor BamE [Verrucomicrobiota bacterium]